MIPAKWPDAEELYPLVFRPIYKERIWGGTLMREVLGRELPATETPIGESWEVSDRPEADSAHPDRRNNHPVYSKKQFQPLC